MYSPLILQFSIVSLVLVVAFSQYCLADETVELCSHENPCPDGFSCEEHGHCLPDGLETLIDGNSHLYIPLDPSNVPSPSKGPFKQKAEDDDTNFPAYPPSRLRRDTTNEDDYDDNYDDEEEPVEDQLEDDQLEDDQLEDEQLEDDQDDQEGDNMQVSKPRPCSNKQRGRPRQRCMKRFRMTKCTKRFGRNKCLRKRGRFNTKQHRPGRGRLNIKQRRPGRGKLNTKQQRRRSRPCKWQRGRAKQKCMKRLRMSNCMNRMGRNECLRRRGRLGKSDIETETQAEDDDIVDDDIAEDDNAVIQDDQPTSVPTASTTVPKASMRRWNNFRRNRFNSAVASNRVNRHYSPGAGMHKWNARNGAK